MHTKCLLGFNVEKTKVNRKKNLQWVYIFWVYFNLPFDVEIGGNNSSSILSNFLSVCLLSGKFSMRRNTSELSKTSSIFAIVVSVTVLHVDGDWSKNICRYSVTASCFSSTDKEFHVAGHLKSLASPSIATYRQKLEELLYSGWSSAPFGNQAPYRKWSKRSPLNFVAPRGWV